MAHENTERSAGAVEGFAGSPLRNRLCKLRIEQADGVTTTSQVPSRARSNGTSTDDGYSTAQLSASVGIRSA